LLPRHGISRHERDAAANFVVIVHTVVVIFIIAAAATIVAIETAARSGFTAASAKIRGASRRRSNGYVRPCVFDVRITLGRVEGNHLLEARLGLRKLCNKQRKAHVVDVLRSHCRLEERV
jgi:hypothetical protein